MQLIPQIQHETPGRLQQLLHPGGVGEDEDIQLTLGEVIQKLDSFPESHTIYSVRQNGEWSLQSPAVVMEEPEDEQIKQTVNGVDMEYLLEVWLAKQVIGVWRKWRNNVQPSLKEKLQAISHYAKYDAYLPI